MINEFRKIGINAIKIRGTKLSAARRMLAKALMLMQAVREMPLQAHATSSELIKRVSFDSDGMLFALDSNANCCICTDKSYFAELHLFAEAEKNLIGNVSAAGEDAAPSRIRNMQLAWIDNSGKDCAYAVENAYCAPNSPANLLGVTKFGKQIELKEEEFPEGTNIHKLTNHSIFS